MTFFTVPVQVFPTPVGVFPFLPEGSTVQKRLPHARGGVSKDLKIVDPVKGSSPRPWGCFHYEKVVYVIDEVFPTPVGVFLWDGPTSKPMWGLPHARGGVSNQAYA